MVREKDLNSLLSGSCPSREVLDLIGDKWTILILRAMCRSRLRYSEIHKKVGGITQKVLTSSLRKLERDGIVRRTVHPVVPPKVEYELTALGNTLFDVLEALQAWSIEHLHEVQHARARYDKQQQAVALSM